MTCATNESENVPVNAPVEPGWYWGRLNGEWRIVSVEVDNDPPRITVWDGDYLHFPEDFERFSDRLMPPGEASE